VSYIPCSGLSGDNLVKASSVPEFKKWYSGPTLLAKLGELACERVCYHVQEVVVA